MTGYPYGATVSGVAGGAPPPETLLSEPWWAPSTTTLPLSSAVPEDVRRQHAAALLQRVYRWLEATAPTAPQVLTAVPTLLVAVQLYGVREYEGCQYEVAVAVGALRQIRAAFPALPPL